MLHLKGFAKHWVRLGVFVSVLTAALIWPGRSESALPVLDSLMGHVVDGVVGLAGHSGLEPFRAWQPSRNTLARQRVTRALNVVRHFGRPSAGWRWNAPPQVVIVEGLPDAPNAISTGPTIYVSLPLLEVLDDRELRAVLAHEMAHTEAGHLALRMGHAPAAVLLQFGRLVRSDWRALTRGETDEFMQELWRAGHWQMIQEMLTSATLGQEMEADCLAAQWLENMRRQGIHQDPTDLVSALTALIGLSRHAMKSDPFNGPRAAVLEARSWAQGQCTHP